MHAYVLKRTQACMGGAPGPGQVDKAEGYPGPQVAGPRAQETAGPSQKPKNSKEGIGPTAPTNLQTAHLLCLQRINLLNLNNVILPTW